MKSYLLMGLSFCLGIICIQYIRTYDKYEKEPFIIMMAVFGCGGIFATIIASVLYHLADGMGAKVLENTFGALFVIGPVEELAKLLAFFSASSLFRKEMNEPVDGIIYISCVALGFSLIENYYYAIHWGAVHLLFVRLFISTPMHICFSALMGLAAYVYLKHKKKEGLLLLILSFFLASVGHGIYDAIIFNHLAWLLLLLVVITIFSWTKDILGYAVARSPYRTSFKKFIRTYKAPLLRDGIPCMHCGSKNKKLTYTMGKIIVQKCDACDHHLTSKKSLAQIFRYFAATFKRISRQHEPPVLGPDKIAVFRLEELNATLEALNRATVEKVEKNWWFPKILPASKHR